MGMSRALRRQKNKVVRIKNAEDLEARANELFSEAKVKLIKDTTTVATDRVIAMTLYTLHKYWGWNKKRILRYLTNLVDFSSDMVAEDITHDEVEAALAAECGLDFHAAMDTIRQQRGISLRRRQEELVELRMKRLIGGTKDGQP